MNQAQVLSNIILSSTPDRVREIAQMIAQQNPEAEAILFPKTIVILNLHPNTTPNNLFSIFAEFGTIISVSFNDSTRTAKISFSTYDSAASALSRTNGRILDGNVLTAQFCQFAVSVYTQPEPAAIIAEVIPRATIRELTRDDLRGYVPELLLLSIQNRRAAISAMNLPPNVHKNLTHRLWAALNPDKVRVYREREKERRRNRQRAPRRSSII